MEEFKWGEEVEVSNNKVHWLGGFRYGCKSYFANRHIVFNEGTTSPMDYQYVRKPMPELAIDEKVWVSPSKLGLWQKAHFAGWAENGDICVYQNGTTSWTNNSKTLCTYTFYSLADPNEK